MDSGGQGTTKYEFLDKSGWVARPDIVIVESALTTTTYHS
jgi:hypothetical protein